jgi:hypothetical protein
MDGVTKEPGSTPNTDRDFSLLQSIQPLVQWVLGLPGLKLPRYEGEHAPPTSVRLRIRVTIPLLRHMESIRTTSLSRVCRIFQMSAEVPEHCL